jgi:3-phosphoshikimate 1-carboxyvinyltransferase
MHDAGISRHTAERQRHPLPVRPRHRTGAKARWYLPITVTGGPLDALDYESPHASAQIKSALLLAGLTGRTRVRVREPLLSRDHTERMLRAMGADIVTTPRPGPAVELRPTSILEPLDLHVPGDFSSAAFFVALALLLGAAAPAAATHPNR